MNQNKLLFLFLSLFSAIVVLLGCDQSTIADHNQSLPSRNWDYSNKAKLQLDIKDPAKPLNIHFRLRITGDYGYSNIFVLFHLKGPGGTKHTRRFEYKLAEADGQWLGSGSGNLFTYTLPLLTNYRFGKAGHYELEVEQNMRDNPLKQVSDIGIKVSE